jgi:molecular chaperone GrpE
MSEEILDEKTAKKERRNKKDDLISALEDENLELKDKLLRNTAELENFKKRINNERVTDRKYAAASLINELLNPLELLDKVVNLEQANPEVNNFLYGFKMINEQINQVLEAEGIKEIKALNESFDPHFHHAVEKLEDRTIESGQVVQVLQKGYMYKDRILRPAMVKVNEWSEENGKDN